VVDHPDGRRRAAATTESSAGSAGSAEAVDRADGIGTRRREPLAARDLLRRWVNVLTLATPLGLLLARTGRARLVPGPRGTLLATGYRLGFPAPHASAVTIGDVVLLRLDDERLAARAGLLDHEARHSSQWALTGGVIGFPLLYGLASLWSLAACRDAALRNVFEVRAGLVDGGYARRSPDGPPRGQPL
jgi:hypothetical protein